MRTRPEPAPVRNSDLRLPWRGPEAFVALAYAGTVAWSAWAAPPQGAGTPPPFRELVAASSVLPALALALGAARCALSGVGPGALLGVGPGPVGRTPPGHRRPWRTAARRSARGAVLGLALAAGCGTLAAAIQAVAEALGAEAPPQASVAWLLAPDTPWATKALLGVHAALVAPLCEETLYRGILLSAALRAAGADHGRALGARIGTAAAVAAVSLLFALAHGSWVALAPLWLVGTVCSACALRTGSLVPGIALHAAFNAANLALMAVP